ncbi:MAG: hypothetical protein HKN25_05170 [Pyrinomonadaceae bacterium]|nr:hypothetical protein [Pyrinomonadaceae bacterium]
MIRRFEYTDILGWSHSRYNTFQTCKRKYYYSYYSRSDERELQIKLNTLKNLTTVALEIGNITHQIISVLLKRMQKTSEPIDTKRFTEFSKRKAREIFDTKIFQEIYYEERNTIDFEKDIYEPVLKGLTNFLESERLEWLFSEALVNKERWVIEPEGFGECRIADMKAYCKVDFLFPVGEEIHVLDWKTGKPNKVNKVKHREQLKGYVTWVGFHLDKTYDQIKPTAAYLLPEYKEVSIDVNEYDIADFADKIKRQTEDMYEYCSNKLENIPLEKSRFPLTQNRAICEHCNFRELCDRV